MRRKAILVTGSRDWTDDEAIREALWAASGGDETAQPFVLIHGDAPGADKIAGEIVEAEWEWPVVPMPAPWKQHGKAAGSGRNARMLAFLESL